jgi:hypothetical protein
LHLHLHLNKLIDSIRAFLLPQLFSLNLTYRFSISIHL